MNREIKFRVWQVQQMKMLYLQNDDMFDTNWLNHENCMQFTGLKDNGSKSVFEGDVLQFKHSDTTHLFEITFTQARFKALLIGRSDDTQILGTGLWADAEIIGNIYENPELLNPLPSTKH